MSESDPFAGFTGFQTHNRLSDEQLQLDISSFKVESNRRKRNG